MILPEWLRLRDSWSDAGYKRDGAGQNTGDPAAPGTGNDSNNPVTGNDPNNPNNGNSNAPNAPKDPKAPVTTSTGSPPRPPGSPGPLSLRPTKTVSSTMTLTMTVTSTTTTTSSSSTSSSSMTATSSTSSSSSSTSDSSNMSTSMQLTSTQQTSISTTQIPTPSFTAQEVTLPTSTTQPSSSRTPILSISIPSTSSTAVVPVIIGAPNASTLPGPPGMLTPPLAPSTTSPTSPAAAVSPIESPITTTIPETTSSTRLGSSSLVLCGIGAGAGAAILLSLILLFLRRRSIQKQRSRGQSYSIPRPNNKRGASFSSQTLSSSDVKNVYTPNYAAPSYLAHSPARNEKFGGMSVTMNMSPESQGRSVFENVGGERERYGEQGGGGAQGGWSSATSGTGMGSPYEDQLPAFAARLQELGIATTNNHTKNAPSVARTGTYNPSITTNSPATVYSNTLPQLQLDLGGSPLQGNNGWFGGQGVAVSDYSVSPMEQQQRMYRQGQGGQGGQQQQTPWQVQLPVTEEARRGSKTSSHIEWVYELSGDDRRR